jgi:hypothetical protein
MNQFSCSSPLRVKNFLFTSSGSHPASYPIGIGNFLQGVKPAGAVADNSLPIIAEAKKTLIYAFPPLYALMT